MGSTSQQSGVVVWEWEERHGLWIPYQADVVEYLEKKYSMLKQGISSKSTVSFKGKHFHGLHCYEVDLNKMEQQRMETGKSSTTMFDLLSFVSFSTKVSQSKSCSYLKPEVI